MFLKVRAVVDLELLMLLKRMSREDICLWPVGIDRDGSYGRDTSFFLMVEGQP